MSKALMPSSALRQEFSARIVVWQARQGRHGLPWQNIRDPYRVWLSEIMLQQTQVSTVLDYFPRFLARFPDVAALAEASQEEVLGLWSGLGYYSRARNLHACAQAIMALHGGQFPRSAEVLQTLPGIGRSTAAAIASFCFEERVSILDGNVKRVLTRVLGFSDNLAQLANERRLWQHAAELLPPPERAHDMPQHTQALMDLGALVCRSRQPDCAACPLQSLCHASHSGQPENWPVRTKKLKRKAESWWLLWLENQDGEVWLQVRPQKGIWAGLSCMPVFASLDALQAQVQSGLLLDSGSIEEMPAFKHVLTHRDLYLHPVKIQVKACPANLAEALSGQWVGAERWTGLGLPAPIRQLLNAAGA
jgi:A/G-specific adenine glycosylase